MSWFVQGSTIPCDSTENTTHVSWLPGSMCLKENKQLSPKLSRKTKDNQHAKRSRPHHVHSVKQWTENTESCFLTSDAVFPPVPPQAFRGGSTSRCCACWEDGARPFFSFHFLGATLLEALQCPSPTPPAPKPRVPEAAAQKRTWIIEKREAGTAASRWQVA
jgi:hypothetical protein